MPVCQNQLWSHARWIWIRWSRVLLVPDSHKYVKCDILFEKLRAPPHILHICSVTQGVCLNTVLVKYLWLNQSFFKYRSTNSILVCWICLWIVETQEQAYSFVHLILFTLIYIYNMWPMSFRCYFNWFFNCIFMLTFCQGLSNKNTRSFLSCFSEILLRLQPLSVNV